LWIFRHPCTRGDLKKMMLCIAIYKIISKVLMHCSMWVTHHTLHCSDPNRQIIVA
jgi:hypothetical protein